MKMKIKYTVFSIILGCMAICHSPVAMAAKLVESGKTWWYESFTSKYEGWNTVIIGLTLDNEDADGWTPCYAIDSIGKRIVNEPLARLQEKDCIVRIRPNLELYKIKKENPSYEFLILSDFLGYWYGNKLICAKWMDDKNVYTWNPDSISEFTLYDFNKQVGDLCQWPWSGYEVSKQEDEQLYDKLGDLEIVSIDEESVPMAATEEKRDFKTFNMHYQKYQDSDKEKYYFAKMMEGIGMVSGRLRPYIPDVRCCSGFFIAPMSACDPDYAGGFGNRGMPRLFAVEEADGTVLILNEELYDEITGAGISEAVMHPTSSDNRIFDLHGRRVTNPQPGSVYIRGGKKFVAK